MQQHFDRRSSHVLSENRLARVAPVVPELAALRSIARPEGRRPLPR